jgi:hypothetical protein
MFDMQPQRALRGHLCNTPTFCMCNVYILEKDYIEVSHFQKDYTYSSTLVQF